MVQNFSPQTVKRYLAYVLIIWLAGGVGYLYNDLRKTEQARVEEAERRSADDRQLLKQVLTKQGELPLATREADSINNELDTIIQSAK